MKRPGCTILTGLNHKTQRFYKNFLREVFAQSEPGIADKTNDIAMAGEQLHDAFFAKAEFPQTILNVRRGTKLFDANLDTCLDSVERT